MLTEDGRDLTALIVTLSMTGKFAMTASFGAVVLYAQEIYPTNVRWSIDFLRYQLPLFSTDFFDSERFTQRRNVTVILKRNGRPGNIRSSINHLFNPLEFRGNYSATSNNMKLVHWPLMGGLLHLVQRGGDWAGPQPAQSPPRCTKCNSPPINGQCTNHRITIQRSVAVQF